MADASGCTADGRGATGCIINERRLHNPCPWRAMGVQIYNLGWEH